MQNSTQPKIKIELITRDGCRSGQAVLDLLQTLQRRFPQIELQIYNLSAGDRLPGFRQTFITPAVWVNDRLWSFGVFQTERLWRKLTHLDPSLVEEDSNWLESWTSSPQPLQDGDLICS